MLNSVRLLVWRTSMTDVKNRFIDTHGKKAWFIVGFMPLECCGPMAMAIWLNRFNIQKIHPQTPQYDGFMLHIQAFEIEIERSGEKTELLYELVWSPVGNLDHEVQLVFDSHRRHHGTKQLWTTFSDISSCYCHLRTDTTMSSRWNWHWAIRGGRTVKADLIYCEHFCKWLGVNHNNQTCSIVTELYDMSVISYHTVTLCHYICAICCGLHSTVYSLHHALDELPNHWISLMPSGEKCYVFNSSCTAAEHLRLRLSLWSLTEIRPIMPKIIWLLLWVIIRSECIVLSYE